MKLTAIIIFILCAIGGTFLGTAILGAFGLTTGNTTFDSVIGSIIIYTPGAVLFLWLQKKWKAAEA
jgi:uncharacterized membrane protein YeaQ/YmgE (transglycosylase-associated protein family)